jgi:hypothetical protein
MSAIKLASYPIIRFRQRKRVNGDRVRATTDTISDEM